MRRPGVRIPAAPLTTRDQPLRGSVPCWSLDPYWPGPLARESLNGLPQRIRGVQEGRMAGVRDDHSLDVGDSRSAEAVEIGVDVYRVGVTTDVADGDPFEDRCRSQRGVDRPHVQARPGPGPSTR